MSNSDLSEHSSDNRNCFRSFADYFAQSQQQDRQDLVVDPRWIEAGRISNSFAVQKDRKHLEQLFSSYPKSEFLCTKIFRRFRLQRISIQPRLLCRRPGGVDFNNGL